MINSMVLKVQKIYINFLLEINTTAGCFSSGLLDKTDKQTDSLLVRCLGQYTVLYVVQSYRLEKWNIYRTISLLFSVLFPLLFSETLTLCLILDIFCLPFPVKFSSWWFSSWMEVSRPRPSTLQSVFHAADALWYIFFPAHQLELVSRITKLSCNRVSFLLFWPTPYLLASIPTWMYFASGLFEDCKKILVKFNWFKPKSSCSMAEHHGQAISEMVVKTSSLKHKTSTGFYLTSYTVCM